MKGRCNSEKPPGTVMPDIKATEKKELSEMKLKFQGHIIQAPKPGAAVRRPRPDEPVTNLELKVSASLKQAFDKPSSGNEENKKGGHDEVPIGASCQRRIRVCSV